MKMESNAKCPFCGNVHGDVCPEFADFPGVEGNMEDLLDVVRVWRCSGTCGKVVQSTTSNMLLRDGWIFEAKDGFIWASCPECGALRKHRLEHIVEKWHRVGSPRGDN
jgi:uncharacterized C2H2 Zn-finger protein